MTISNVQFEDLPPRWVPQQGTGEWEEASQLLLSILDEEENLTRWANTMEQQEPGISDEKWLRVLILQLDKSQKANLAVVQAGFINIQKSIDEAFEAQQKRISEISDRVDTVAKSSRDSRLWYGGITVLSFLTLIVTALLVTKGNIDAEMTKEGIRITSDKVIPAEETSDVEGPNPQ